MSVFHHLFGVYVLIIGNSYSAPQRDAEPGPRVPSPSFLTSGSDAEKPFLGTLPNAIVPG
jgi:hypothetical protein